MKKILFLMLSLAVAGSAFATVQKAQTIDKSKVATQLTKQMQTSVKLTAANPFVKKQQGIGTYVDRLMKKDKGGVLRAVVSEQPAGTVKYYTRTAGNSVHRYYDSSSSSPWGGIAYGAQEGTVLAVENGSTIWFKNLLYDPDGYFDDYWIQGTKQGTRVTIQLQQEILNYSDGSSIILVMGDLTYVQGSGFSWTRSDATTARFNISGNTLTLQGTSETSAANGTYLGCDWDDGYGWAGFADAGTTLTVDENVPTAPTIYTDAMVEAMEGTEVEYYRTGNSFYYNSGIYMGEQSGSTYVFYAADGSVYMRNPVYGWRPTGGAWVKGTISGNKITVPLGQYLTWQTSNFLGLKTAWGEVTFPTDSTVEFTQNTAVNEVTYTINGNVITLDGTSEYVGLATIMDSAYVELEDNWYPNLDYSTTYYAVPEAPTAVTATPAATTADVAWTDDYSESWNLRYREYQPASESYFNDFNDYGSSTYLEDWYIIDHDGDGYNWNIVQLDDAGTDYAMWSASYVNDVGAVTPDNWLISEALPLNGVVKFRAFGIDASWAAEHFAVYLYPAAGTDWESTDDFIAISDEMIADGDQTHEYVFTIPEEYQGMTGRIAIRHFNITDMFYLVIDDFFVGDPDQVVIPWTVVTGATNPYTIEGLTPETTYEVQVQGVIGGGNGLWSESTIFTTLAEAVGLRGDVNDDGVVNINDVTVLINHLLSQDWESVPGQFNFDNADCDLNGTPGISDVTALINYLLKKSW